MNWEHSFDAARLLAGVGGAPASVGRPRQIMLRSAAGVAYYGMFHALCGSNADTLVGASPSVRETQLWVDTYRALPHSAAKNQLRQYASATRDPALGTFARAIAKLQDERIKADYDPSEEFSRSRVSDLIDQAEAATRAFANLPARTRRMLAIHLLIRRRN